MRGKIFTNFLRRWTISSAVFFISLLGVFGQEIPYPVWFDLGDQPEFKTLSFYRNAAGYKGYNDPSLLSNINWVNRAATVNSTEYNMALTAGERRVFGDLLNLTLNGSAGISELSVKLPYLIAGTYEFWITYRNQGQFVWVDSLYLLNSTRSDSTKQILGESGTVQLGNWGTGGKTIDYGGNMVGRYICNLVIPTTGSYWVKFYFRSGGTWVAGRGWDEFHLFPMKMGRKVDDSADSMVIKNPYYRDTARIDIQGNYKDINNISYVAISASAPANKLSYQAVDSSTYTEYNVNVLFGTLYKNKPVQILREEDRWTRMVVDTLPASGTLACQLPAGTYYFWVADGGYKGTITVTGTGDYDVHVDGFNVTIDAGAESWTIDKHLIVYDFDTKSVIYADSIIGITGIVNFLLSPGHYYYTINGAFDNGEFTIVNTDLNIDKKKSKYNVTFNFGADSWFTSKTFIVQLDADRTVEMYNLATNASGSITVALPDQKYYYTVADNFTTDTFRVAGSNLTIDKSGRHNATFYVGNVVNGYTLDVFRNDTIKLYTNTIAAGVQALNSIPDGNYHFRVFKSSPDSVMVISKHSFKITGADYVYGSASNLNGPLMVPYPVYFDICDQPEIIWGKPVGSIPANTIAGIKTSSIKNMVYNYEAFSSSSSNQYINGDHLVVGIDTTGVTESGITPFITFKTPWINAGRYNVYISQRWTTAASRPIIDSSYLDGKLLEVTDGIVRTLNDWANLAVTRPVNGVSGGGNLLALHLGSVDIETSGLHELKLISKLGGSTQVWLDILEFIPVDQDVSYANGDYYPRFDRCGKALFPGSPVDNTIDPGDHGDPYQVPDPSAVTGFTKQLVFDAGVISDSDVLVVRKAEDNWTRVWKRIFTNPDTASVMPGSYNFLLKDEGLSGTFSMSDNKTVTIPTSIGTTVSGKAKITQSLDGWDIAANVKVDMIDNTGLNLQIDTMKGTADIYLLDTVGVYNYSAYSFILGVNDTVILTDQVIKKKNEDISALFLSSGVQAQYQGWGRFTANNGFLAGDTSTVVGMRTLMAKLSVYPNPVKDVVKIQLSEAGVNGSYTICNATGMVVASGEIRNGRAIVNMRSQKSGMYIVQITSGKKTKITKLLKQ